MAFDGWMEWSGTEVINTDRTEAYAAHLPWFKPVYNNCALGPLLGEYYTTPMNDEAPWIDGRDENTNDFYGVYPMSVSGLEDSTGISAVTEGVLDGGVVGRLRRATRSVVYQVILLGGSDSACEAGMRWLVSVMSGLPCFIDERSCVGQTLCYLSNDPCVEWEGGGWPAGSPEECLAPYQRRLRNAGVVTGPTILSKQSFTDGGAAWIVSFTVTAGSPYAYGAELPFVAGFMDPSVDDPYVGGAPDGARWDDNGVNQQDPNCWIPTYQPLEDPECPQAILPPNLPGVTLSCFEFPVNFRRRFFDVPRQFVPLWSDIVPKITFHTTDKAVRSIRVRFYANLTGASNDAIDPCAFCGDLIFSYIPPDSTLVFDAADQTVWCAATGGPNRRADALVFGSDGAPFEWPQLTCGYDYSVTVDSMLNKARPVMDMSLYTRTP